ncbi:hypothetical protein A6770_02235 [Nostoc minutum NIES-26]|uniref:DUF2141 domain-containing protein n=1 Tax=Nostoc minutum NIES-26 TaxID=1844469 RepID=A0A367QTV2_9NOSO|nr:DUF2141 domain-containing protein [Dendronalium sp. ChiSLP03b]MDZ8205931.1 DUF2141 domain-containing protein [Dendronalium sp. ChiSLP03b]RCJ27131.1 hypothetical protein A6770_02235 [Nostoc minutum NIES-26]
MVRGLRVSGLLLAVMGLTWSSSVRASLNGNLSVEIDGVKNKQGQVCVSIFASSQGFPSNRDRIVQKQCTKITETPVKVSFNNLKAGNYAVAVIHDRNNDLTLNRNNLGMPTEGFGFSRNPEVRTSAPKFGDAAFLIAGPNTNIQIQLKYF